MGIKKIEDINTFIKKENITIYLEYYKDNNYKHWILIDPNVSPPHLLG
jgi:septal ring-binding cell division protein DamX